MSSGAGKGEKTKEHWREKRWEKEERRRRKVTEKSECRREKVLRVRAVKIKVDLDPEKLDARFP